LSRTADINWDLQPVGIWSSLESTVAVICASAPVLKPLVSKVLPRFFSTLQLQEAYSLPDRSQRQSGIDFRGQVLSSDPGPIKYDREEKMEVSTAAVHENRNERLGTPNSRTRTAGRIGRENSHNMYTIEEYEDSLGEGLELKNGL
jgi:hypothetical protein